MKGLFCSLAVALLMTGPVLAQENFPLFDENGVQLTDDFGNFLQRQDQPEERPAVPEVEAVSARGGVVRVLDKINGTVTDLELGAGQTGTVGALSVLLSDCRYPASNPSGDAYELLTIHYRGSVEPLFRGWMIASSPAVSAMDHPRYDVWALRCMIS